MSLTLNSFTKNLCVMSGVTSIIFNMCASFFNIYIFFLISAFLGPYYADTSFMLLHLHCMNQKWQHSTIIGGYSELTQSVELLVSNNNMIRQMSECFIQSIPLH